MTSILAGMIQRKVFMDGVMEDDSMHDDDDYDRASELEVAGGRVLDLNPSQWSEIAQAA